MTDVSGDGENRRVSMKLDARTLRFDPQAGLVAIDELNLESLRHDFARNSFCHRIAKQCAIRRLDKVCYLAANQLRCFKTDQACGRLVGQQYFFVMDNDDLG